MFEQGQDQAGAISVVFKFGPQEPSLVSIYSESEAFLLLSCELLCCQNFFLPNRAAVVLKSTVQV